MDKSKAMKRAAYALMARAEVIYLRANGWKRTAKGQWSNREQERRGLVRAHAVNVQKQFDRRGS